MLGRLSLQLGVCALLCACNGNIKKKSDCAADGGCSTAATCIGKACADASADDTKGSAGRAGNAATMRTQAMRVARDAGAASQLDAASAMQDEPSQPDKPSKGSSQNAGGSTAAASGMKSSKSGQSGAGGAAMKAPKTGQAGQGGAGGGKESEAEPADCEQSCDPCQACGDDHKTCQPVTGRDDADSCNDTRSCSSRGECLHLSEAQADLGTKQDSAELSNSYAQVLTFSEPATIQEIRLEVSCKESDQSFPAVWLAAAPGGIPSDTIVATANVVYQAPTDNNAFALLELSKTLEEPAAGPLAIVVSKTDMSCNIRLNTEKPYPHGALFTQTATLWTPAEGSMVFQVLSSQ